MKQLAYTYEADYHCIPCALDRFGYDIEWDETIEDDEGNPLHPVFDTDEHETPLHCGTCGDQID